MAGIVSSMSCLFLPQLQRNKKEPCPRLRGMSCVSGREGCMDHWRSVPVRRGKATTSGIVDRRGLATELSGGFVQTSPSAQREPEVRRGHTSHRGSASPPHFSLALSLFRAGRKNKEIKEAHCKLSWQQASNFRKEGNIYTQYLSVSEDASKTTFVQEWRLTGSMDQGEGKWAGKKKLVSDHVLGVQLFHSSNQRRFSSEFRRFLRETHLSPLTSGGSLTLIEGGFTQSLERDLWSQPSFLPHKTNSIHGMGNAEEMLCQFVGSETFVINLKGSKVSLLDSCAGRPQWTQLKCFHLSYAFFFLSTNCVKKKNTRGEK